MAHPSPRLTRRTALAYGAAGFASPFVMRAHAAAPSETLYHASIGAAGMAGADIESLTASPHLKLVAVADVDQRNVKSIKERFPDVKVYEDWRKLLDREKNLNSVNVSVPDHMHAPITMTALQPRAARLLPETADPDDLRSTAGGARRPREKARHADGHPDPFARDPPDDRRDDPGRDDRQGQGSP